MKKMPFREIVDLIRGTPSPVSVWAVRPQPIPEDVSPNEMLLKAVRAAHLHSEPWVQKALDRGADPDHHIGDGITALHWGSSASSSASSAADNGFMVGIHDLFDVLFWDFQLPGRASTRAWVSYSEPRPAQSWLRHRTSVLPAITITVHSDGTILCV